jgi:hypothetical protein
MSRLLLVTVATVLALAAILLAHDVRSLRDTLRAEALTSQSEGPSGGASTWLPSGLSGRLLSVGRDRQWLKAIGAFGDAYRTTATLVALQPGPQKRLASDEAAIGAVAQDPDHVRASQAYNLLAVLAFREAFLLSSTRGSDSGLVQQSLTEFQNAIRLDPAADTPKANLERALRTLASQPDQAAPKPGGRNRGAVSRKGSYGGPPGMGY